MALTGHRDANASEKGKNSLGKHGIISLVSSFYIYFNLFAAVSEIYFSTASQRLRRLACTRTSYFEAEIHTNNRRFCDGTRRYAVPAPF